MVTTECLSTAEEELDDAIAERCGAFASLAASVGAGAGLAFGIAIGVLSGALPDLRRSMALNSWEQGMVVASVGVGGLFGALLGGWFADVAGRKWAVVVQSACFVVAAVIASTAQNLSMLVFGQLWMGAGSALSQLANVAWINEAVPAHRRGGAIAAYELCVTVGVFLAFLINEFFVLCHVDPEVSWRLLFASMAVLPLVNIAAIVPLPESPIWLLSRGKRDKAMRAVARALAYNRRCEHFTAALCGKLRHVFTGQDAVKGDADWEGAAKQLAEGDQTLLGECDGDGMSGSGSRGGSAAPELSELSKRDGEVASALVHLEAQLALEKGESGGDGDGGDGNATSNDHAGGGNAAELGVCARLGWNVRRFCRKVAQWRVPLGAILGLIFFSQVTGGLIVRVHASDILQSMGMSRELASAAITVLGVIKVISTAVVVVFLDSFGRRPFLLIGIVMMVVSATILAFTSALTTSLELRDNDVAMVLLRLAATMCCWVYTAAYQLGFGPVQFAVGAELFPSEIRGRFLGLQICLSSLLQAIVFQAFPVVTGAFQDEGTGHAVAFAIHAGCCIFGGAFFYVAIVETKVCE